jgi:hypothetical protein
MIPSHSNMAQQVAQAAIAFEQRRTGQTPKWPGWGLSKNTYDTDFQAFMDRKIASVLSKPIPEVWGHSPPAELPTAASDAGPALFRDLPERTLEAAIGEPMGT